MESRLDFSSNHERCLVWPIKISRQLTDCDDDFTCQVGHLVHNSERLVQFDGLDGTIV